MSLAAAGLQRAAGCVELGVRRGARGTVLETLRQQGCLRARFPKPHGGPMEAVLMNTAGGVADGDALRISLAVAEGAALTLCTPGAERIYRAMPEAAPASMEVRASIGAGGRLDYLPQETILYDGCALERSLHIDLHPQGTYLGVEALLFGRAHFSRETLRSLWLRDTVRLRRDGRLVVHDSVRVQGQVSALLGARACADGGRAVATILFAAQDAQGRLGALRGALEGADAGASAWDGIVIARLVAADGQALRRLTVAALAVLREKPLPRLWAS